MIRGVGIDAVPIARMKRALERTPGLARRVFTEHELETADARGSREQSLAVRFAAKEACRKTLGKVIAWRDMEVVASGDHLPSLRVVGHESLTFHISLTHTDGLAMAVVVAETR